MRYNPRRLIVPQEVLQVMRFAAIEVWPTETVGFLLGEFRVEYGVELWRANASGVYQLVEKRTPGTVVIDDEKTTDLSNEFFGDLVIGSFHSHPSNTPTLSKGEAHTDFENMEEGDIELIISLWPSKRGGFNFRHRAYTKIATTTREPRAHRRVEVVIA